MKKTLSLICAVSLVFVLVLAGCTKEKSTETTTAPGSVTDSAVTVKPADNKKVSLSAFIVQLDAIVDVTTNKFTKYLEDKTNVEFKFQVAPQSEANQKLKLLMASGDYPDVIMSGGLSRADLVQYGSNEKVLIPLNPFIVPGTEIYKVLEAHPKLRDEITAPDGNIYALPGLDMKEHVQTGTKLWMNTQWLQNLGLKVPETTEDFKNVLKAFKTKDPNGNKKADEIPLSGAFKTWAGDPQWYLMNAFILADPDKNFLINQGGKLDTAANKPEWKAGLTYIRDLFKEGLIDPSGFTQPEAQLSQLGNNPTEVLGAFSAGHLAMGVDISTPRGKEYDAIPPLTGPSGVKQAPWKSTERVGGFVFAITKKAKNPEAAFRVADYLYSNEGYLYSSFGLPEMKGYRDATNGELSRYGNQAKYTITPDALYNDSKAKDGLWLQTTLIADTTEFEDLLTKSEDFYAPSGYVERLAKIQIDKYTPYKQKSDEIPGLFMDNDTSQKITLMETSLKDYVIASTVEFITGKKDIEKDWDGYVKGLNDLKLADYLSLYQKALDEDAKKKK